MAVDVLLPCSIASSERETGLETELLKPDQKWRAEGGFMVLEDDDRLGGNVLVHNLGVVEEYDAFGE